MKRKKIIINGYEIVPKDGSSAGWMARSMEEADSMVCFIAKTQKKSILDYDIRAKTFEF